MKTDRKLGEMVRNYLVSLGIETPINEYIADDIKDREEEMVDCFERIVDLIGLDITDDSISETPKRMAKMYLHELFEGMDYDNFPKCTNIVNKFHADEMVIEGGITVSSSCEHHFQSIDGFAKVAYIPKRKVLGLSKMNRIVRFFSKRPQVQERLTLQIQAALVLILGTENVAIEIRAVHHCVKSCGIEDGQAWTTTRKLGGVFKTSDAVRNEFLNSK